MEGEGGGGGGGHFFPALRALVWSNNNGGGRGRGRGGYLGSPTDFLSQDVPYPSMVSLWALSICQN